MNPNLGIIGSFYYEMDKQMEILKEQSPDLVAILE